MEKPVNIIIEETKQGIAQILNESKLPIYIVNSILKDFVSETNELYRQELIKDNQQWTAKKKTEEEVE